MYRITAVFAAMTFVAVADPAAGQTAAVKASAAHHAAARAPQKTHLTVAGTVSDYSESASEKQVEVTLAHKISLRTTLFGSWTQHDNFNVVDAQVQAGVTHAISRRAMVTASYTQGIGADLVAGNAVDLKLAGVVSPHLHPFIEYNFSRFEETAVAGAPRPEADEQTITLGAEMPFNAKTSLSAAYQYAHATDREGAHGGTAFITHHVTPRFAFNAGGSYATAERLVAVSRYARTFLTALETAGATAGFTWTLSRRAELDFTYEFTRVLGEENIHKFAPVVTWGF